MENTAALQKQSRGDRLSGHAKLTNLLTNEEWEFIWNPENIREEITINSSESPTIGSKIQYRNYTYTSAPRYSFSDLLLDGWCSGYTVEDAIASLKKLEQLNPDKQQLPTIAFQWGSKKLEPCILEGSLSIVSDLFLDQGAARSRVSFTLVEVRVDDVTANDPEDVGKLTERQRSQAREAAGKLLSEKLDKLDLAIREKTRAYKFSYLTDEDGNVWIVVDGKKYKVGVYDGSTLNTEGNELGL